MRLSPVLLMVVLAGCSSTDPADPVDGATPPVAEAGTDAPTDSPVTPIDSGTDADAGTDAADSAPPVCTEAGRYTTDATTATDSKGGLKWRRAVTTATIAFAPAACNGIGRHATRSELLALVLPGCVPSLDADVFTGMPFGGEVYASDGCVDMAKGTGGAAACTSTANVHVMCVLP